MTPADVGADRKDGTPDHERIWLEPKCTQESPDGRSWCKDDVWGECDECGTKPTEYIRKDIPEASIAALEARVTELEAGLASLVKAYAACVGEDHRVGFARALLGDEP